MLNFNNINFELPFFTSSFRLTKLKNISFITSHIVSYPTPLNLSYFWSFGSLLGLCMVIQILTGIFLAMHYTPHVELAFDSLEHIMRDVQYGYLLRYCHANGASMIFILLYLHLFRGIYYGSFINNIALWFSGILLFLLVMGTAFLGYVLPWGQMSFWGATVITNLASAIPFIGDSIVEWLWGGFSVANATLNRFFSFHYLLPFAILGVIVLHLNLLHQKGSANPLGVYLHQEYIRFYPFFWIKDVFSLSIFFILCSSFIFFSPNMLGHTDNYILANPMVTPTHIVPEWYFLPFYAILRSIPNKLLGVIGMLGSILLLLLFPLIQTTTYKQLYWFPLTQILYFWIIGIFCLLGWLGQKAAIAPYVTLSQILTFNYFFFVSLLIFLPFFLKKVFK